MEEHLVRLVKLGDKGAFVSLIKIYERKLYVIARSKLDKEEDVKDVVQETICQTLKSINTIKNDECFGGWITRILLNNCNDILRYKQKMYCSYDDLECENYIGNLDDALINVDDNIDLFSMIDFLGDDERVLLALYFLEGYTTKEMSEILQINENTIRTRIMRIKLKIKDKYGKEEEN